MSGKGVFANLIWSIAERTGAQLVGLIVTIVLGRILMPKDFGTIALITVFIAVLQVFVDSGLGTALIQKKNADDLDFSSVFYFNIVICAILYMGMFFAAPLIARFYEDISLVPVIRVISLLLLISGVKNIQQAYISRNLLFRKFFFATLGGTLFSAVLGITMACQGMGVWALVAQYLSNAVIDTIILWITVKWRPKRMFSIQRLKELLRYGWKLLVSALLDTGYLNLRKLIVGKMYSPADLSFYDRGDQIPKLIVENINSSIDKVLLPVMADEQDSVTTIRMMTRRAIKTSTYIMAPMMIGLCVIAESLIRVLLTDKWLLSVQFLRVFSIMYIFYPIHTANLNAIKAMGRSDLFLKLEIIKKCMGLLILVSTMRFGALVMAYSLLVSDVLCQIINSWPNRKLLNYTYFEQLRDIFPGILMAVFMGVCVSFVTLLGLSDIITIIVQVVMGAAIYFGGSFVLKNDSFLYLSEIIAKIIQKEDKG